jgi:hypothetical protein
VGAYRVEAAQAGAAQVDRFVFPHRRGAAGQDREGGLDVDGTGSGHAATVRGLKERMNAARTSMMVSRSRRESCAGRRPRRADPHRRRYGLVPPVGGDGYGRG